MIYSQGPVMCIVLSNHVTNLCFFTTFHLLLSILLKSSIAYQYHLTVYIKNTRYAGDAASGSPPP